MLTNDHKPQSAIIFTSSSSVRGVMRDCLKQIGTTEAIVLDKCSDVMRELKQQQDAWFLIDFANPVEEVYKVLAAAQGPSAIETRPIYIVGGEVNVTVVIAAIEYNVSKIRLGTFNSGDVTQDLQDLLKAVALQAPLRTAMGNAQKLMNENNREGACEILQALASEHSTNPRVVGEYIDYLIFLNRTGEAEAELAKIQPHEPDNLRLQHLQARCLMKRRKYEEAIRILAAAEETNPWNPARLIELGNALLATSQFNEAKQRFEKALSVDEESMPAKSGQAQATLLSGNMDEGLNHIRNLGSPRQMASTLNAAAVIAARTKKDADARELYKNGIQLLRDDKPSVARLWFNFGILEHRCNRFDRALKCFETALVNDPKFTDASHNVKVIRQLLMTSGSVATAIAELHEEEEEEEEGTPQSTTKGTSKPTHQGPRDIDNGEH